MGKTEVKFSTIAMKTFNAKCLMLFFVLGTIASNTGDAEKHPQAKKYMRNYPSIFQAWSAIHVMRFWTLMEQFSLKLIKIEKRVGDQYGISTDSVVKNSSATLRLYTRAEITEP